MKVVIVDIKGRYAVALNKQGQFIKIRNNGQMRVGYEVEVPSGIGFDMRTLMKAASIAAVFFLTIGLSYGVYSYSLPYSYVNVDINPSVEITANIYNRILKVEALNNDGQKVLEGSSYKNIKLEHGIEKILDNAVEKGYLKGDTDNAVMFTVSSKDDEKSLKIGEGIRKAAVEELESANIESNILVDNSTLDKHDNAKKLGISPGKLSLIEKLIEVKPELNENDLKDAPVKEIMKSIINEKKDSKDQHNNGSNNGKQENKTEGKSNEDKELKSGKKQNNNESTVKTDIRKSDASKSDKGNKNDDKTGNKPVNENKNTISANEENEEHKHQDSKNNSEEKNKDKGKGNGVSSDGQLKEPSGNGVTSEEKHNESKNNGNSKGNK